MYHNITQEPFTQERTVGLIKPRRTCVTVWRARLTRFKKTQVRVLSDDVEDRPGNRGQDFLHHVDDAICRHII